MIKISAARCERLVRRVWTVPVRWSRFTPAHCRAGAVWKLIPARFFVAAIVIVSLLASEGIAQTTKPFRPTNTFTSRAEHFIKNGAVVGDPPAPSKPDKRMAAEMRKQAKKLDGQVRDYLRKNDVSGAVAEAMYAGTVIPDMPADALDAYGWMDKVSESEGARTVKFWTYTFHPEAEGGFSRPLTVVIAGDRVVRVVHP